MVYFSFMCYLTLSHTISLYLVFFFNYSSSTEIYTYLHTLSLHDSLPIWPTSARPPSPDGYGARPRIDSPARAARLRSCCIASLWKRSISPRQRERGAGLGLRRSQIGRASCRERVCQYV